MTLRVNAETAPGLDLGFRVSAFPRCSMHQSGEHVASAAESLRLQARRQVCAL